MESRNSYNIAPFFVRQTKGESMGSVPSHKKDGGGDRKTTAVEDSSDDMEDVIQVEDTPSRTPTRTRETAKRAVPRIRSLNRANGPQTPYRPGLNTMKGKSTRNEPPKVISPNTVYPKPGESSRTRLQDQRPPLAPSVSSSRQPLRITREAVHPTVDPHDTIPHSTSSPRLPQRVAAASGSRTNKRDRQEPIPVVDMSHEDERLMTLQERISGTRSLSPIKPLSNIQDNHDQIGSTMQSNHFKTDYPELVESDRIGARRKGKGREGLPLHGTHEPTHGAEVKQIGQAESPNDPHQEVHQSNGRSIAVEEEIEVVERPGASSHRKRARPFSLPSIDNGHSYSGVATIAGLRSSRAMKGRDGHTPATPYPDKKGHQHSTKSSPLKAMGGAIVPSSLPQQNTAEIERAWIAPNNIPYVDNFLPRSPRCTSVQLFVELQPSAESARFLYNMRNLVVNKVKLEVLEDTACAALRESCNSQIGDTRTRAARQRASHREGALARPRSPASGDTSLRTKEDSPPIANKGKGKAKQEEDSNQTKLKFNAAPRRSSRISGSKGPDDADTDAPQIVVPRQPAVDKNELYFPYPPAGKADVNITHGDAQRLQEGEFLNDTLLEFGLRYVMDQLDEEMRQNVHLFNSFFYDKLSNKSKKSKPTESSWSAYDSVKKWTKGKDVFSKSFVVVPINENYHWYLAVIVNPGAVLQRSSRMNRGSPGPLPRLDSGDLVPNGVADHIGNEGLQAPASNHEIVDKKIETQNASSQISTRDLTPVDTSDDGIGNPDASMMSRDELDCIGDDSEPEMDVTSTADMQDVEGAVEDMSLDEKGNEPEDDDDEVIGPGQPIVTPTMMAAQSQKEIFLNGQRISDDSKALKKNTQPKPDVEIIDDNHYKGTWIITFDSLGGSHKSVGRTLNLWLQYEARDKRGVDIAAKAAEYWEGRVPQQPNFYDCGLYVVHYAQQLLMQPFEVLRFIQRRPPTLTAPERAEYDIHLAAAWRAGATSNLRGQWIDAMALLASRYTDSRDSKKDVAKETSTASQAESDAPISQPLPMIGNGENIAAALRGSASPRISESRASHLFQPSAEVNIIPLDISGDGVHSMDLSPLNANHSGIPAITPNGRSAIPPGIVHRTRSHFDLTDMVEPVAMDEPVMSQDQPSYCATSAAGRDMSVDSQDVDELRSNKDIPTSPPSSPLAQNDEDMTRIPLATPLRNRSLSPVQRRNASLTLPTAGDGGDSPFSFFGQLLPGKSGSSTHRDRPPSTSGPIIPFSSQEPHSSTSRATNTVLTDDTVGAVHSEEEEEEEQERIEDRRPVQPATAWDPLNSKSPVKFTQSLNRYGSKGHHTKKRENRKARDDIEQHKRLKTSARGRAGQRSGAGATPHEAIEIPSDED
ncbi:hypothetical protein CI109_106596 [Kwoniella shandongensis]|uniref:Uncharacterized protein n=1 Tax=Kwoniella shandongensis TaxID=1734106 RepID=A0A5M6C2S5_9TREE|nr:uncharacterized protein CI109_002779 [Kwoniella shandongensis]KAA5529021.1 hypothetical protein CI109_002779 [Kwoniella shandongensis]